MSDTLKYLINHVEQIERDSLTRLEKAADGFVK
jgi:hypothetical protein